MPWVMFMNLEKTLVDESHPSTEPEKNSVTINVLLSDQSIVEMDMEEYVLGVLFGEMPSTFEVEALKAQAVATRTFARRNIVYGEKHEGFDICTDASCCQCYADPESFKGNSAHYLKFSDAVNATTGYYLLYGNNLAETTYFSCSGGRTEDAAAVWGTAVPYLVSVESPGEENAIHYLTTKTYSTQEFCRLLGDKPEGFAETWIKNITYTKGGGVDEIQIGNKIYTGTQIRQLLDLKSTAFRITAMGGSITISTRGFGHRVGMSQYGADAMAVSGSTFEEILAYYYPGTELNCYPDI